MAISVVAQGTIVNWATAFNNPVLNVNYQINDFIVLMSMNNGGLTNYPPSGFTVVGTPTTSNLTLYYRKMTSSGSSLTLSNFSGTGGLRYLVVRGAYSVVNTGNTNGDAKNMYLNPTATFFMITTGNSSTNEFSSQGFSVLPSQWGTNTNYYTVAYKQVSNSTVYLPAHPLWSGNENYLAFSEDFYTVWNFNATNTGATGSIQYFTVPSSGKYAIEAWGAGGVRGNGGSTPGLGAYVKTEVVLKAGDSLAILVGQTGTHNNVSIRDGAAGGGGGASTVALRNPTSDFSPIMYASSVGNNISPLVVAAGGGGGNDASYRGTNEAGHHAVWTKYSGNSENFFDESFLGGGAGNNYSRGGSVTYAGYGGGRTTDDSISTGGGWYTNNNTAYSYYQGTNSTGVSGNRSGNGYVRITRLQTVVIDKFKVTSTVHKEDVNVTATLISSVNQSNENINENLRYRISVNDKWVYPVSGYINAGLSPQDVEIILPNNLFDVGSNTIVMELLGEEDNSGKHSVSTSVTKTNIVPVVTVTESNSPIHKENLKLKFKVTDGDTDLTKFRIVLNNTDVINDWSLLNDYSEPRDLIIENKRLSIGDNTVTFQLQDDMGGSKSTSYTYVKSNEKPTVEITYLEGTTLRFRANDSDGDLVAFRILINDVQQMPESDFGDFTNVPFEVEVGLDTRMLIPNSNNKITVEVKDDLGATNATSETKYFGYSGLLFCDVNEVLYSTDVGYILKTLYHDKIVAGNASPWREVWVKNTLGYDVYNVTLATVQGALNPDTEIVELSYNEDGDIISNKINLGTIATGKKKSFFVRVDTTRFAITGGRFYVTCTGDPLSE
jgi:hypothetical protein